jgi:hypothetical protein
MVPFALLQNERLGARLFRLLHVSRLVRGPSPQSISPSRAVARGR